MFKFFDLNSIRSRMVSGFLFLTLLIFVVAMVSLYLGDRNEEMATVSSRVNQLEINTLILLKNDNDYFDLETTNEVYFQTGESYFLQRRDSLLGEIVLRKVASAQRIEVHGVLWLFDRFLEKELLTSKKAIQQLKKLMIYNRRLPMVDCEERLAKVGCRLGLQSLMPIPLEVLLS